MEPQRNDVTVVDIRMPFLSMVLFMVKWAIASIPALIILVVLGFFVAAILAALGRPLMEKTRTFGTSDLPTTNTLAVDKQVPKHEGWINDTANVLSGPDRERLSDILRRYQRETHHQLTVLTVPTLSGENIERFSDRVANAWGLGYKGLDNGILVTLAIKERKVRIELGRGMEPYISESTAQSIITSMTPALAKGDFAGGLESGLNQLMEKARTFVIKTSGLPANNQGGADRATA